jgi:fructose-specific phosphotransferase system IIA component
MLVIVMHNKREYLEALVKLMRREGISDATVIEKKNIGVRLIGMHSSIIFHKGNLLSIYDKAFVAVIRDEERIKRLINLIETDPDLLFLNTEDKGFICTLPFHYLKNFELESLPQRGELKMKVTDYLDEIHMELNLKASSKEEAIKNLGVLLKNSDAILSYDVFIKDVFEREMLNTTGIGHNIAIPHARTDAVNDFVIAFGRIPNGLEFGSLDKMPVKLIFLMGTPKEKGLNSYLKILSSLTRRLGKESFREQLLNASNPGGIIEIFKNSER